MFFIALRRRFYDIQKIVPPSYTDVGRKGCSLATSTVSFESQGTKLFRKKSEERRRKVLPRAGRIGKLAKENNNVTYNINRPA